MPYLGIPQAILDTRYLKLDASNDPITGDLLLKPASDSITVFQVQQAGGAVVFDVDTTNERVGIGIDAPLQLLHVRDVTPILRIHDTKEGSWTEGDVFSGIEFFTDDDTLGSPFVNAYIRSTHLRSGTHTSADAGLEFGTSHYQADPVLSTKMAISNIGNVGIGTITPLRSLHIHNAEFAYVHLTGPNSGAGPLDGITFGLDDKNSRGHFRLREPWPLIFWTNSIERLTIDGDGLVGIGDQTPDAQLEVQVGSAVDKGLIVQGAASQSANLLELQESDGSIFLASGDGLGGSVFSGNQQLEDIDFVWAGDTEANLFRVDAGADAVRMGDWDTNYVEVDKAGDVVFVGGAGLAFGEICAKDNATPMTLNSAAKVQVTIFDVDGVSNNMTPDHTNDHITVTKAGMYLCTVSMAVENGAGASHKVDASVWKNNGATEFINTHTHRDLAAGSDVGSMSLSGIIDLAVNDTIEVWLDTDRGSDSAVTVEDITLSLVMVGGT